MDRRNSSCINAAWVELVVVQASRLLGSNLSRGVLTCAGQAGRLHHNPRVPCMSNPTNPFPDTFPHQQRRLPALLQNLSRAGWRKRPGRGGVPHRCGRRATMAQTTTRRDHASGGEDDAVSLARRRDGDEEGTRPPSIAGAERRRARRHPDEDSPKGEGRRRRTPRRRSDPMDDERCAATRIRRRRPAATEQTT